jgi:predicted anti-sigma-YlaC factor YlaD
MKSKHITEILDRASFAELSELDKSSVSVHVKDCASCRQAFEAARLSAILLESDTAASSVAPSPFFQAKVMNAWRERQQMTRRPIQAFRRWWQASAAPVFVMLTIMIALVSLTFIAPQAGGEDSQPEISSFNLYTTDAVIMDRNPPRDLTTEQVFQVVYTTRNEVRK